jgi:nitrite reductase/ring-hydroxylating ferredoxin subunit
VPVPADVAEWLGLPKVKRADRPHVPTHVGDIALRWTPDEYDAIRLMLQRAGVEPNPGPPKQGTSTEPRSPATPSAPARPSSSASPHDLFAAAATGSFAEVTIEGPRHQMQFLVQFGDAPGRKRQVEVFGKRKVAGFDKNEPSIIPRRISPLAMPGTIEGEPAKIVGFAPAAAPAWLTAPDGTWIEVVWSRDDEDPYTWCGRLLTMIEEEDSRCVEYEFVAEANSEGELVYVPGTGATLLAKDQLEDEGRLHELHDQMPVIYRFPIAPAAGYVIRCTILSAPPRVEGLKRRGRKNTIAAPAIQETPPTQIEPARWFYDNGVHPAGALDGESVATHRRIPIEVEMPMQAQLAAVVRGYSTMELERKTATIHAVLDFVKRFMQRLVGGSKRQGKRFLREQVMGAAVRQERTSIPPAEADVRSARAATSQARAGNLGRAARKLDQNSDPFTLTPAQIREQLVTMHPDEPCLDSIAAATAVLGTSVPESDTIIASVEAIEAVNGMSKGAAPGPTGWTSELMSQSMKNPEVAIEFAAILSDIAAGHVDETVRNRLTSARLIALPKEPTKARPIAVGEVFLKAASLVMFERVLDDVGKLFKGLQFGVGFKGGGEAVIHNVRYAWDVAIAANQRDFTVCTIDCKNAFNAVKRSAIVSALKRHPEFARLTPLLNLEYGSHSKLHYGERDHIMSRSGVRQGSVLGPFWFALAIHDPIREVLKRFPAVRGFMYLDDVTLHGPARDTAAAATAIGAALAPLGLEVNAGKCEWLTVGTTARIEHPVGYKPVDAIKVLGAFIGDAAESRKRLQEVAKKHVAFFRRLPLLEPDIAAALLEVSGIPRVSYYARTHHPDIIGPFLKEFDARVMKAWMFLCDIKSVSETTKKLAKLSTRMGGLGFTSWEDRCPHAYAASREASMLPENGGPISFVRESDRVLAAEMKEVEELRNSDIVVKTHMEASKGCSARLRDTSTGLYFPIEGIAAVFRWLLLAPHALLKGALECPGCKLALKAVEFFGHVAGCARCHGYNASSRHAGLKKLLHEIFTLLGLTFDAAEPRAFNTYTCRGCDAKLKGDDIKAHLAACPHSKGVSADVATDRSGPDGRLYLPGSASRKPRVIVWDVTILSTTAQSHRGKPLESAMGEKKKEKDGKYKAMVLAENPDQEFIVIGGSALGELSATTQQLLRDCIAASNSAFTYDFIARKLSAGIMFCSGHVIAEAERRAGVIHQTTRLQTTQLSNGRKGSAGCDVADNDGLCCA